MLNIKCSKLENRVFRAKKFHRAYVVQLDALQYFIVKEIELLSFQSSMIIIHESPGLNSKSLYTKERTHNWLHVPHRF